MVCVLVQAALTNVVVFLFNCLYHISYKCHHNIISKMCGNKVEAEKNVKKKFA